MPFRTVKLAPGVNTEYTPTLNQTQLSSSNLIRFYAGLVTKLGGWQHFNSVPLIGVCRGMYGWADVAGNAYMACGTEQRLQVLSGGSIQDITPVTQTTNPAVAFSTVSTQVSVTVTDTVYQPNVGDWIKLNVQVSVGGLVLFGYYQVTGTIGGTQYTINAPRGASSTVTNGGAVPSFTTSNGSATVTVTFANHGLTTGGSTTFNLSTTVGGLAIVGNYLVTVINANSFTISASGTATSGATVSMNSGNTKPWKT